ncbi:MAG: TIGR02172 family protein [Bacteroidales bacterium]|nr:TIGR02172 family protein [Bacteroidales bacterium]MBQ9653990.1 TIGR02172 family protein [Bacteroidales bacterium]MBR1782456.1 TIGR02172 family protein [Bacteroidales bacterium]
MAEQQYLQIDLSQWQQVGEGGNGKTYINSTRPDVILKVNSARLSTLEAVRKEYEVSKAVGSLGIPVPRMQDMVRVGDAYATISERIVGKQSLSRICHDHPENIEEMAQLLCDKGKQLFATPCKTDFFPSRRQQMMQALDGATFISKKTRLKIRAFAETIQDSDHCVHGDFQMGNLIQAGDKCYWIDLDRFAHGDPMFDIGHLYLVCMVYSTMKQARELFHMEEDQLHRFWDAFAAAYTGKKDHAEFDHLAGKYAALDIILRTIFVRPTFLEKLFFKMHITRLVKNFYNR